MLLLQVAPNYSKNFPAYEKRGEAFRQGYFFDEPRFAENIDESEVTNQRTNPVFVESWKP